MKTKSTKTKGETITEEKLKALNLTLLQYVNFQRVVSGSTPSTSRKHQFTC